MQSSCPINKQYNYLLCNLRLLLVFSFTILYSCSMHYMLSEISTWQCYVDYVIATPSQHYINGIDRSVQSGHVSTRGITWLFNYLLYIGNVITVDWIIINIFL